MPQVPRDRRGARLDRDGAIVKALVTGATGFLGGAVVKRLAARGVRVRALVRDRARAAARLPNVELAEGDLSQPQTAVAALEGCDVLFHIGALVKRKAPKSQFDLVNVTATQALIDAAERKGIRSIYTSSFFALGPSDGLPGGRSPQSPMCELAPHTDYERTKRDADRALETSRRRGAPTVTLYPGVLYGPGEMTEANLVVALLRDFFAGKVPGLPGGGAKTWCYALVDDVADAHVAALEKGEPGSRIALPGENATGARFFEVVQELTGRKPPRLALPIPAVWVAGAAEEAIASLAGREPKLTRSEALTYAHDWALDGSLGARVLGARYTPLRDGLAQTLAWMKEREPALFSKP